MSRDQFHWAVFVAVLLPLFLRQPGDSLWMTVGHIGVCLGMIGMAAHWPSRRP